MIWTSQYDDNRQTNRRCISFSAQISRAYYPQIDQSRRDGDGGLIPRVYSVCVFTLFLTIFSSSTRFLFHLQETKENTFFYTWNKYCIWLSCASFSPTSCSPPPLNNFQDITSSRGRICCRQVNTRTYQSCPYIDIILMVWELSWTLPH